MSPTAHRRRELYDFIAKVYKLRSQIAHGEEPSTKDASIQCELDELVREILRIYCRRAATTESSKEFKAGLNKELVTRFLERAE